MDRENRGEETRRADSWAAAATYFCKLKAGGLVVTEVRAESESSVSVVAVEGDGGWVE